jgi:non-specific serine/threonine protein kinase
MGEVYKARDTRLDRTVAIKVLPTELSADPDRRTRFEREARAIAGLSHPHICTLHDVGEHDGSTYLVMEHLSGETLADRLRRGSLPLSQALEFGAQIADALDAAHKHGVIHRDLKPGNVMLTTGGQGRSGTVSAKLLDFGLAKLAAHGERPAVATEASVPTQTLPVTARGHIVGTLQYMAPEQLEGKEVDARTDLWALGALLFEMVIGKRAFEADSEVSLIGGILNTDPPGLATLQPLTPPALDHLVRQCLAKSPDGRPDTAHDVGIELRWLRESSGLAAPAPAVPQRWRWWPFVLLSGVVVVATVALIVLRPRHQALPPAPAATAHPRSAIAVLPFRNLSADAAQAYFAGGLHDELLTQLSKVASLKVISRTSVMGYLATTKSLTQIADELNVGTVVEGSVQVGGGRLRVNAQLIDAATDQHLWADRYDRTLDDAFAIQSDLAQKIVAAVGAVLSTEERGRLAQGPTENAEAYRLYLQGREHFRRPGYLRTNLERAEQLYEQALRLDPGFALAHAALSRLHGRMYFFRIDPSPQRQMRQGDEADAALRLAPHLPESHLAMAQVWYFGRRDWRRALDEYRLALDAMPNDADLLEQIGFAYRRLGEWDEVFAVFEAASRISPRDANLLYDLGGTTYELVGRYADAVRTYDRALTLAPEFASAAITRGWAIARWRGQLDALREALDRLPGEAELDPVLGSAAAQRAELWLLTRDSAALVHMTQVGRGTVFDGQDFYLPGELYAGWACELDGDRAAAEAAFTGALVKLDETLRHLPDDWRVHAARGFSLAHLGRRDRARHEAEWLRTSAVYRADAAAGPRLAEARAKILAQAGYADEALEEIERLLSQPSWLSVHLLRLDPRWDPIRSHPRFKALLAKYSAEAPRD